MLGASCCAKLASFRAVEWVEHKLNELQVFELLPLSFQQQLLLDRDPHGNVQVAKIETERLLLELVEKELAMRKQHGKFNGKFSGLTHYMGYEGRASLPTNFDATYASFAASDFP